MQTEDEHRWLIAFLATVIVLLLARPVKDAVQSAIDRAFYRDRYDYRRALVAFARDLNGDLDLNRLSERLVSRVKETFVVDRMALMLATDSGEFEPLRTSASTRRCRVSARRFGIGARLAAGHCRAARRSARRRPFHRGRSRALARRGHLLPGAVRLERADERRVRARPARDRRAADQRRHGLLSAVAGQAATAIENGRLYRQLHLKASELDRLRAFNENILESLDDGLLVVGLDDRVIRWNQALERFYGVTRADALGQPLDRLFDAPFLDASRAAAARSAAGHHALPRAADVAAHAERIARSSST